MYELEFELQVSQFVFIAQIDIKFIDKIETNENW